MRAIVSSSSKKARGALGRFSGFWEKIQVKWPGFSRFLEKVKINYFKFSRVQKRALWIALVAIVIIGAGSFTYFKVHQSQVAADQQPALQTAVARQGDLILRASGAGTLTAATEVNIGFRSSGQLTALNVKVGDKVEAGQLLAQLDDATQQIQLAQANQSLLESTSPVAVATARQGVAQAQKNLYSAQASRSGLTAMRSEAAVANAYAGLVLAQDKFDEAQEQLDSRQGLGENSPQYASTYQNYYNAMTARDHALYIYNIYSGKPSQVDIDMADSEVALAEAQLTEAQNLLAALTGGDVPVDATGSGLMQLNQAKLNLLTAQDNLKATQLYAPISGIVMAINGQVGTTVSGTLLTIDDLSQANIDFYMDASDWSNVKVGYDVEVTFDALPDQVFTGKVIEVMPGIVSTQGSSMVKGLAQLDKSVDDIQLPVGVDAAIDVISGQAKNAVLVPVEALHELSAGQYAVFVMENGKPTLRSVEVGLQDTTFAEIKSGLKAGEVVTTGIVETAK